jgi:hypothetical protein
MTAGDEELLEPAGEPSPDPWARVEAVATQLNSVAEHLKVVSAAQVKDRASSRRTRHLAVGLAVSLVLDVVLTVVVSVLTIVALNQSSTLHASQLAACAIGNQSKIEQQQLWGYLFQLSGGVKSAAEKQFLTFVDKTFTPVNCAAVYK